MLRYRPTACAVPLRVLARGSNSGIFLPPRKVYNRRGIRVYTSRRGPPKVEIPLVCSAEKISLKSKSFARFCIRSAKLITGSFTILGICFIGLIAYDAHRYNGDLSQGDVQVSKLALNPRLGGPKHLPIAEVQIDDDDNEVHSRQKDKPKLVILGSGWGSVALLKTLNPDNYHITVVSPTNYFLYTPLLPSATNGTLELRSLAEPIRRIIGKIHGHFIRASAENIEFSEKLVELSQKDVNGNEVRFYLPYDKLVIGVGSTSNSYGVKGLENCYSLKDIGDAQKIRNRIMSNLEYACLPTTSENERKRILSFVICGGGPTGVEFAAELVDFLNEDLVRHFPQLLRNEISIHLVQSRGHILNTYDEKISKYVEQRFARDQIDILTNARVKEVQPERILFTQKSENGQTINKELEMGFCLWSTGVSQTKFCQRISTALGSAQKNRHALETDTHLRLNGTQLGDVYAIGDCATVQNNVADHLVMFLRSLSWKMTKDPEKVQLTFSDWRSVAHEVKKNFPQAAEHLKRLDKLFETHDVDRSGTLNFEELRMLLTDIDSKLTSLPATAQRAHQQGEYLGKKFNTLAGVFADLRADHVKDNDVDEAVFKAFKYQHVGNLAYIGNSAVFDFGNGHNLTGGLWAAYAWRSVYFAQSVSMRTRILLAMDWAKKTFFGRGKYSNLNLVVIH